MYISRGNYFVIFADIETQEDILREYRRSVDNGNRASCAWWCPVCLPRAHVDFAGIDEVVVWGPTLHAPLPFRACLGLWGGIA